MNVRLAFRLALLVPALFIGATPNAPASVPDAAAVAQEVRIRKLHLVRPDLIPYPLYYDVLC